MSGQAGQAARATGREARRIADSRWFETTARAGFVGSGIVHLLIGWLVVLLAIGTAAGSETDQSGALQQLEDAPGGVFLLWLVAIGTAALAIRLALEAVVGGRSDSARAWGARAVDAAKAVIYAVVCWSAVSFATGAGTSSSGSTRSAAAKALATPGGVFVLFLAAAVAVGVGTALVVKGARRSFEEDLVTPPKPYAKAVRVLGTVGYIGKGIAIVVVGVLLAVAAVRSDPQQATGLDGAFDALHEMPGGTVVLVAVGIGFVAYGVYSFFRARYARL